MKFCTKKQIVPKLEINYNLDMCAFECVFNWASNPFAIVTTPQMRLWVRGSFFITSVDLLINATN